MRNLRVSNKLIISFAIVIALAVSVAMAGLWGMSRIKQAADDIYEHNVSAVDVLGLIRENFALQRQVTRELVIYSGASELYAMKIQDLEELERLMEGYIERYSNTVETEADKEVFGQFLYVYYEEYAPFKVEFIAHAGRDQTDTVMELIRTRGNVIVGNISSILNEAHELNVELAKEALRYNNELSRTMRFIELVVLTIAILIVILLVVYLSRLIATPLNHMAEALNRMGSTGEMRLGEASERYAMQDADRSDEIGMATQAIIKLLRHIWGIEQALAHISEGDFDIRVQALSDRDTMAQSVSKVLDNLNDMFGKLKAAEESANAASKAKGAFLAHMSHEIRTPLNAIIGMSMVLRNSAGEKEKTLIDQLIASSHHLANVVNDVLDMSKIESGKFELAYEPFAVKAALNEVMSIISQRCSEKGLSFITNIDTLPDYWLLGDKTRINQILINLSANAVKFTSPPGEVRLWLTILEETDNDAALRFDVADNGVGLSEGQLKRLFRPFEQVGSNESKYGGTGLGLSISHDLVEMMGGELEVTSELGVGSSFHFDLRLNKSAPPETEAVQAADVDLSGKRLLIVEDVEINRMILQELLSENGLVIEEAENGQQALEMFERSAAGYYDLILMDVLMPVMNGLETTRRIRGLNRGDAQVPIIAMTANAYKEDADNCISAGMNAHLSKPIDIDAMRMALERYLIIKDKRRE